MNREAQPAVEVRGVEVRYGDTVAVHDANLIVEPCRLVSLVGPSGCGKTSLLRTIAGFEEPSRGSVLIDGEPVAEDGVWVPAERRRIGMVFQQGALFPHLDVRGNVSFGLRGREDADERTRATLELTGLSDFAGRYPDQLSGGQQQRVALARALAPAPRVVLLDEPFASLDAELRERLREEVRAILIAARSTAILVTHDQEEALSFADRVAVMSGGRILQFAEPDAVYRMPATPRVAELVGGGRFFDRVVANRSLSSPLGTLATGAPDGPGRLLVRPEDLVLLEADRDGGLEGVVVSSRFFGHGHLLELAAAGDTRVRIRVSTGRPPAEGERVRFEPRRRVFRFFSEVDGCAHQARLPEE